MNYYKQGDAAKAEEIKAAFEKLGYDVTGFDMCNDNILFFTYKLQTGANVISTTNAHLYTANIIKTHPDYKELKLLVEPKFKDGDVLCTYECGNPKIVFILRGKSEGNYSVLSYYCYYNIMYPHFESNAERGCLAPKRENVKPATKEQRDLLFAKMKEAGYQWDADKKELRKIQPHYDIANFKPKQWVLVRQGDGLAWRLDIFSHLKKGVVCQFECVGNSMVQCIPFGGNEHLLGTTDMCDECYINWK